MKAIAQHIHTWWVLLSVMVVGLVFSYWDTISALVNQWLTNDDFSHGFLIIPISLYLVWEKRESLKQTPLVPDWHAFILVVFSISVYTLGELGAELFTTRVSLVLLFIAVIWLLFGTRLVKTLSFPLLFLFLMLPLPGFIYRNLTFPLQILSSKWAVAFLQTFGIMAYREGNVIDLGFTQFQVVEACNGLRFILPLLTLGVLFAFWNRRPLWKRLALVSATIPIAISANVFRIGGTGVLSKYWGQEVAEGFFHSFSGWAVFMVSFAMFFGLNRILNHFPDNTEKQRYNEVDSDPQPGKENHQNLRIAYAVIALLMIVATPLIVNFLGTVEARPLRKPLSDFPEKVDTYLAQPQKMGEDMWERVGGQAYYMANYHDPGRADAYPVNFYVAYYECQRKAGDFIHSPKLCLPGAGWYIKSNETRTIKLPTGETGMKELKFNELIITKGNYTQLVYYWYQGRGRNFTSEYAAKFWMVWDGVWRRRTDGALVRLVQNLAHEDSLDEARDTLDRFASVVSRELENYLP